MRSTSVLRLVPLVCLLMLCAISAAVEIPVLCQLRSHGGKHRLVLRNLGRKAVAVTSYRWAYRLDGWNQQGKQITDEAGYGAKADLIGIRDSDWRVLKPGAEYSFPVEFYSADGVVSARVYRGQVTVRDYKPPSGLTRKGVASPRISVIRK